MTCLVFVGTVRRTVRHFEASGGKGIHVIKLDEDSGELIELSVTPDGHVRLAAGRGPWQCVGMHRAMDAYRGFRFQQEIIARVVWLYHNFSLSLRDVELILAARGVTVTYESIRAWGVRFGQQLAASLKRRRPKPGEK